MNAGPEQVHQTCMLVCTCLQIGWLDATVKDMRKWPDAIATDMADGRVQM